MDALGIIGIVLNVVSFGLIAYTYWNSRLGRYKFEVKGWRALAPGTQTSPTEPLVVNQAQAEAIDAEAQIITPCEATDGIEQGSLFRPPHPHHRLALGSPKQRLQLTSTLLNQYWTH